MIKKIDARGQACPKPVIMTKKELDNLIEGVITTIVDNEVAKENVSKLASSMGLEFDVEQTKEDEYLINIKKGAISVKEADAPLEVPSKETIAIGSNKMGSGEEELGKILMKSFIFTVKETSPQPANILFYNSGVYLTCEDSPVIDDLKALAENGVEILSCGTCLDYYNLKDKLAVGGISNMYTIYEKMKESNTINIG
ncbi:sulfurtransferase-like selenium metabolism protein YedF [Tissierella sp. Yu-01]|uniref:sulfurtransferase-like selenium metabolism protein YedF n=1 Tax=Tissierella sp. Yu-01 TaxID=3035694 RepID=UPI00240D0E03|nr:sulfurtransferase-like selenium metabolism protein YedF [Tissierella sp. Yu-01]WFA08337.1 sulfurtransferase-like selenium metabolism protein YedF [Tissierella sp. Yu-01]